MSVAQLENILCGDDDVLCADGGDSRIQLVTIKHIKTLSI